MPAPTPISDPPPAADHRLPTIWEALIPVVLLIAMLTASVILFGYDSSYGPNQIALILAGGVAAIVGIRLGFSWKEIRNGMVRGVSLAMGAIFILLVVGSLIGTWILAGIVPTMIAYGLQLLNPSIFLAASCVICAVVALATGSSWTTVSTIGIALVGVAAALDLSLGMTAGAIISGSYFGDKLSPLSDTTNLAPAMAGTDLFTHIRHMLWTTVPSLTLALILFTILGFTSGSEAGTPERIEGILASLNGSFNIRWYLLLVPAVVIFMVVKKVPAFPALLIGSLLGGLTAVLAQPEAVIAFAGDESLSRPMALLKGFWKALFTSYEATTDSAELNDLLSRGGMDSMLNTVWLIISAMMFGAAMETTKMLEVIAGKILGFAKSTGSLIGATLFTSLSMNIVASDQYIAIVVPGRMYRAEFLRRKLAPKNLSRALEDAGTLTSPLVPWNTCGAFMASALGVATVAYLPFAFFNLFNPVISAIYGFTGFTIEKLEEEEVAELA
ncbi:MAG: Na+/H+ antiporter NhaC [Bacteroidota bacterium]